MIRRMTWPGAAVAIYALHFYAIVFVIVIVALAFAFGLGVAIGFPRRRRARLHARRRRGNVLDWPSTRGRKDGGR